MFKVDPLVPYAKDYRTCIQEAKERVGKAPIQAKPDITGYDTIYIMTPIYWGTYAPEMESALEGLDWNGKTVRIITTHEGSGLAGVPGDVARLCKEAKVDRNGLSRGKQRNVAVTAVARELACFVWGMMTDHMDVCN